MRNPSITRLSIVSATIALLVALLFAPGWGAVRTVSAQDQVPAVETTVTEQPTPTNTSAPPATPTATNTPVGPTATPTLVVTLPPDVTTTPVPTAPPSGPVPIPEPVTVVLFGTGLAALSAALASRRKNDES
jgi:hypothetical protein